MFYDVSFSLGVLPFIISPTSTFVVFKMTGFYGIGCLSLERSTVSHHEEKELKVAEAGKV